MFLGEVFAMTTGLEFMYSQSPPNMKSMVIAIFYLTQSLGSYLGALIVAIVNGISAPVGYPRVLISPNFRHVF